MLVLIILVTRRRLQSPAGVKETSGCTYKKQLDTDGETPYPVLVWEYNIDFQHDGKPATGLSAASRETARIGATDDDPI